MVLKQATGAKDDKTAWRHLPLLTGCASPNEIPTEVIKLLGPALNNVIKKLAKLENGQIVGKSGNVLWPKEVPAAATAAPAAAPPPPAQEAPPPPQEEPPSSEEGPPPSDADTPMF